jgi:hypothetical protein
MSAGLLMLVKLPVAGSQIRGAPLCDQVITFPVGNRAKCTPITGQGNGGAHWPEVSEPSADIIEDELAEGPQGMSPLAR